MSNPVIKAVDDGHFTRTVDIKDKDKAHKVGVQVCRLDGEAWPCSAIKAARAKNTRRLAAQNRAALQSLTPTKVP